MARLSISMLGSWQILLDGEPVNGFESDKVRALLSYLVLESDRCHRREALAGMLWPDHPEQDARHSLSQALSNLRHAFSDHGAAHASLAAPPFFEVTRQTIQFNRASDHWLDTTALTALLETCRQHSHRRLDLCEACLGRLDRAVELYRGDLLAGFSLGDSAPFEEWVFLQRERFHHLAVDALRRLSTCHERRGERERTLQYARRHVALEPWKEEAHRQMMHTLAAAGQRGAAMAQYAECRRVLKQELDVEPEEETRALYRDICDGREPLTLAQPSLGSLPAPVTPFVGRERELAEVKARLHDPACRLLTLIGPGGIGKSRLALEAGRDLMFRDVEFAGQPLSFSHGVYLVSLTAIQSPDAILPTLAEALGFSFYRENPAAPSSFPKRQLLGYLRHRSLLLILDSFEHVLPGAALVAEILHAAPQVKVLVTSRARLGVQGEYLYPVRALEVSIPAAISAARLEAVRRQDAVELFLTGARRVRPGYEATAGDLRFVAQICRMVQGIPLAILMAAAWMDVLSPAQIAAQIADRTIDFLQGEGPDHDAGQGSMRAVFDRSWGLLGEREREVFRTLSVFRGGFTLGTAREVAGASLRELRALAGRSLLHQSPGGRYAFQHELLHQYAAEKLAALPAAHDEVQGRHGTTYAAALERWAADLKGPRQQEALAEIEAEIEEVRAAWEWATAQGNVEQLAQAAEGLGLFYEWRVRYHEGDAAFRAAANTFEGAGDSAATLPVERLRAWAHVLAWHGLFSCHVGRASVSRQLLQRGQGLLDEPDLAGQDTRRERAFLLRAMGEVAYWSGSRADARQCYLESLALYRALDDRWATARALLALAATAQSLGAFHEARQFAQDSLAIRRALGDTQGIGDALWQVGWVSQNLGLLDEAERLERDSIVLARQTRDRPALAQGLHGLGSTLAWQGKFVESLSLLEECLAIWRDLGAVLEMSDSGAILGIVEGHLGRYKPACRHIEWALALAREADSKWEIGIGLFGLGCVMLAGVAYAEAHEYLQESAAVFGASGHRSELGWALAALGGAASRLGQPEHARQCVGEALGMCAEIRDALTSRIVLPFAALVLADLGQAERAVEVYAFASRYPIISRARLWEDVVGKHVSAAAAVLPADAVAAAQERGRAQDLWAMVEALRVELGG